MAYLERLIMGGDIYDVKKYTAGDNVQITDQGVISSTDTKYAAGTGIAITGSNNAINAARNPDNTYTKEEVDALVAKRWQMKDVDVLPATGEPNIIYLVPRSGTHNDHDMFIWEADKNSFKYIGRDTVDLSGYATKSQAISNITRNGTTFTATRADGTTFTFTQQDTTYGASSPITLTNTTFGHANSGVTAGTYGPSGNVSGTNGTTINVPQISVNATGHVTGVTNRVYTSVDSNTTYGVATTSANGLMSAADKTKLNNISSNIIEGERFALANQSFTAWQIRDLTVPVTTKTGYVNIFATGASSAVEHFHIYNWYLNGARTGVVVQMKNQTDSTRTTTVYVDLVRVKNV